MRVLPAVNTAPVAPHSSPEKEEPELGHARCSSRRPMPPPPTATSGHSPSRPRLVRAVALAGLAALLAAMACSGETDDDNIRGDVLACEEAVAHIIDCCGGDVVSGLQCVHYFDESEGCGQRTIEHQEPDLNTSESNCIRDSSCGTLRDRKVCERVAALPKPNRYSKTSTSLDASYVGSSTPFAAGPPVCP